MHPINGQNPAIAPIHIVYTPGIKKCLFTNMQLHRIFSSIETQWIDGYLATTYAPTIAQVQGETWTVHEGISHQEAPRLKLKMLMIFWCDDGCQFLDGVMWCLNWHSHNISGYLLGPGSLLRKAMQLTTSPGLILPSTHWISDLKTVRFLTKPAACGQGPTSYAALIYQDSKDFSTSHNGVIFQRCLPTDQKMKIEHLS